MATATSLYDELILLIGVATTIDDAEKQSMIAEIERDGLTPAMQERVTELFRAESAKLGAEIQSAETVIQDAEALSEAEERAEEPTYEWLGQEYEAATQQIEDAMTAACRTEVNAMEKNVEQATREDEAGDIEQLRSLLKTQNA